MPPPRTPPDKLSLVVYSGTFDKVHYALVMAAAAAAMGKPVTLFFTMGATRALMAPAADGTAAWRSMPVSADAGLEGDTGGAVDDAFKDRGVATFEELLAAAKALDAKFMVCEMGLRAMGIERDALRDDIELETGGVVTFLNDASADGTTLFV